MKSHIIKYTKSGLLQLIILVTHLLIFAQPVVFSQQEKVISKYNENKLFLSLAGGITRSYTDYKLERQSFMLRSSIEYNLLLGDFFRFGFGSRIGYGQITGEEKRSSISTIDGVRDIPPKFVTPSVFFGIFTTYGIEIERTIHPFINLGVEYLNFNPKLESGEKAFANENGFYSNGVFNFNIGGGIRVNFSNRLSAFVQGEYNLPNSDYLDDVAASKNNDTYITALVGVSYNFMAQPDKDGDGIPDDYDFCPDQPEIFNGIKDEDGCPEIDTDGDGILDELDLCPEYPEDMNGFEDEDGCPDADTDKDGVPDFFDNCPGQKEDIDNFEDNDGCPDLDNDKDGIPDKDDKCPDEAETFNEFNDSDGCPDTLQENINIEEIILDGDDTFYPNSAKIRETAYNDLHNIAMFLKGIPNTNWRIEGHMDSQAGVPAAIKRLSYDRANAILNYFISKGLDQARFQVYGLGDSYPIGNNLTEEGRKMNRRVRLVVQF